MSRSRTEKLKIRISSTPLRGPTGVQGLPGQVGLGQSGQAGPASGEDPAVRAANAASFPRPSPRGTGRSLVHGCGLYHEEMAALDDAAFAARTGAIFAGRRADLAGLAEADLARQSWTPVGPRSYGGFLEIRIFDFWVHERDISTPLGWPSDDGGPRAEIALGQVEASIGYIVGKKIGLPDGASIVFHLTGPVTRDLAVVVDGRARAVDHVERPDVELTTSTVTFIAAGSGPDRPATADRRLPRHLDRERPARRVRRAQPEVHHLHRPAQRELFPGCAYRRG